MGDGSGEGHGLARSSGAVSLCSMAIIVKADKATDLSTAVPV
jgi:hypothetical protein